MTFMSYGSSKCARVNMYVCIPAFITKLCYCTCYFDRLIEQFGFNLPYLYFKIVYVMARFK